VLFLQRDEFFPLERVVAVIHPTRRIIAYHLLWRDDVHGSWIPFTVPTDEEIVWVGYDSTSAPSELWTFWHGSILHTPWKQRGVGINVQWGKHGSLPRGVIESDLPAVKKLNDFYAYHFRDYVEPIMVADRIDAVARVADPRDILIAVFGRPYSKKKPWP
jgi:hypothetical protein